jgi:hypothetical protein
MPFAPGKHRSWIFPSDPNFADKAGPILDLYQRVWEGAPLGADDYVTCADEKTSIQARRRKQPTLPPAPNRPTHVEHEYFRLGAWTYLAAWDVHRARVFGRCEVKSGIAPVNRLVGEVMGQEPYKSARRVFWIMDNCSAHRGQKAANRLRDRWPNLILIHTPVHASGSTRSKSISRCLSVPLRVLGIALQLDLHPPRSPCSSGQDRRQTAGSRSLTEYVTVIPNVSTKQYQSNAGACDHGMRIISVPNLKSAATLDLPRAHIGRAHNKEFNLTRPDETRRTRVEFPNEPDI